MSQEVSLNQVQPLAPQAKSYPLDFVYFSC